ncbi:hypothetical protein A3F07_00275 [candidate division WWE3 bacterium RIFCSPHIGHO2_12_FULL_38_15]|uniref:Lipid II isoglutaminyl synthase (glutamine-hydrolyzing) subunit GatD n=1 Tax=candidate division WWE3 bacterium RIFCSPHIGHO2_02_FULL_38_14 TaxID=1802620 RepID=A0A1F4V668_UNCKA
MKLKIGFFYSNLLNLYGDTGNVEILRFRAEKRGIDAEVIEVNADTKLTSDLMSELNIIVMGGGPDSGQKQMYEDLLHNKGSYLKEYIESGGAGIYICGSYQLLGHYYKSADGKMLDGLGVFDLYTRSFGVKRPRCIGNMMCELNPDILNDPVFRSISSNTDSPNSGYPVFNFMSLVGFENHSGRTYLGAQTKPFAKVIKGHGNNSEDGTEGVHYKNSIGTYMHGPIFSRNPHLADYLIGKALKLDSLDRLDDSLVYRAHSFSETLPQ